MESDVHVPAFVGALALMLKRSHLPSVLAVVLLFTLSGCKKEGERLAEPGPVLVAPLVAAGKTHSLAVRGDGTVWAWGFNTSGQLGDGTYTLRRTPGQVSGPSGVIALAAGPAHSLAVSGDGTVWSWGDNWRGQLGDGKVSVPRATPLQVAGLSNVLSVAAGEHHSLAVRDDGTVWAWGDNRSGQLGDGAV